jgi:cyclophilin family peptidyl-prolyl cis-trans isomerase
MFSARLKPTATRLFAVAAVAALPGLLLSACAKDEFASPATEVATGTLPPDPTTTTPQGSITTDAPAGKTSSKGCPKADGSSPKTATFDGEQPMCIDVTKTYTVTMVTTKGTMTFKLDPAKAPKTANNFATLARWHYFDGIKFHRVVREFVIQGGDPQGTGMGGPGYKFNDELPSQGEYKVGSLAMANSGPNTNGSQFFIITGAKGVGLPPNYSLFGQLTAGDDVMKAIDQLGPAGGEDGPPSEEVSMTKVTVAES